MKSKLAAVISPFWVPRFPWSFAQISEIIARAVLKLSRPTKLQGQAVRRTGGEDFVKSGKAQFYTY